MAKSILYFGLVLPVMGCGAHEDPTLAPVLSLSFSADSHYLAVGTGSGTYPNIKGQLVVWKVSDGTPVIYEEKAFTNSVRKVFFLKSDTVAGYSLKMIKGTKGNPSDGAELIQLDVGSKKKLENIEVIKEQDFLSINSEGVDCRYSRFAYVQRPFVPREKRDNADFKYQPKLRIVDLQTGENLEISKFNALAHVLFHPTDNRFLLFMEASGDKVHVRWLDLKKHEANNFIELGYVPSQVRISDNGQSIVFLKEDGLVEVFEVGKQLCLASFKTSIYTANGLTNEVLAISPDGEKVAVRSGFSSFRILSIQDQSTFMEHIGEFNQLTCVCFSPDGSLFAAGYHGPDRRLRGPDPNGHGPGAVVVYSLEKKAVLYELTRWRYDKP